MFGGKRKRSRKRRSRRRRGGNLVKCMSNCRNDAAKSSSTANEMKNAMKGVASKSMGQKMSALNKYKAAAEKQKKIASTGLMDANKAIAAGKAATAGPTRGVHSLRKSFGGKRRRRSRRRKSRRKSRRRSGGRRRSRRRKSRRKSRRRSGGRRRSRRRKSRRKSRRRSGGRPNSRSRRSRSRSRRSRNSRR